MTDSPHCSQSPAYELFRHLRREHGWTKKKLFDYFRFEGTEMTIESWWQTVKEEEDDND